ncbi:hypothetical protein LHJ74_13665 [Streptomyces sp. N2-109]|uniref:Orc1-like AAA ATPase domain-containing protein n=1 Tax=Streptomyces gossypii TaxID=2883101 RepID=A0ABT2JTY1_9ACTN|nr:hypothetical protein [Streptomyces gossypii]MCT2590944.1 hypothetical protein [Streptomyces gossypii]
MPTPDPAQAGADALPEPQVPSPPAAAVPVPVPEPPAGTDGLPEVAEALKGEPPLLIGLGAMIVVGGAGAALGGAFLPVAGAIVAILLVALVVWFIARRPRATPGAEADVRLRRLDDVELENVGTAEGDSGRADVRIERASGTRLYDVGRVGPAGGKAKVRFSRLGRGTLRGSALVGGARRTAAPPAAAAPGTTADPAPAASAPAPAPAPARSAAPPMSGSLRAVRSTVLDAVAARPGARVDIVADSGCGKTRLLNELAEQLKEDGYLTLFVSAQAPAYGSGAGAHDPTAREMAEYGACRALVDGLAADVGDARRPDGTRPPLLIEAYGRELERTVLAARDTRLSPVMINTLNQVRISDSSRMRLDNVGSVNVQVTPPTAWDRALLMQEQVLAVLGSVARERPLAVLVDDLQAVLQTSVGTWLLTLLDGLSTATVIHARWPLADARITAPGMTTVRLGPMDPAETHAYVSECLTAAGWQHRTAEPCAETVYRATRGHPLGVATCTEIIVGALSPDAPPAEISERILGGDRVWEMRRGSIEAMRRFVDEAAAQLIGRPVELFDHLVVIRRCTEKVLAGVLAEQGVHGPEAAKIHDWLARSAFTTPFDDDADQGWRLHDYLRANIGRELAEGEPTRFAALHAVVERHYRKGLTFDETLDADSPHSACARYENPDWQRDSKEWLHHAAHLSPSQFPDTKRAMIRLFFEAFWWWDMEVDSGYCAQLVMGYRAALPASFPLEWIDWLDALRAHYVAGQQNQVPGAEGDRWARAGEALMDIWLNLGLSRSRVPSQPDLRRIHIIFCCLQGDVVWYGSQGTERDAREAAEWYRTAATEATEPDEEWIGAWATWMEAKLHAASDPARARRMLDGIGEQLADDNELRALVTLTYGDLAWHEGDHGLAFDIYARAVLHAFVYHIRQEEVGTQQPNEYTHSLYQHICGQVRKKYELAAELGLDGVVRTAEERSRRYFAPYWQHVRTEPGPGPALPRGPKQAELGIGGTPFAKTAKWVLGTMQSELEEPLTAPHNV